jgi:hypothetical protein
LIALLDALDIDFALMPRGEMLIVNALSTIPGVVFGAFFGAALWRARGIGVGRFLTYILASGLGYLAAFHASFLSVAWIASWFDEGGQSEPGWMAWALAGALGGLAGSLLLGLASKFLLRARIAQVLVAPLMVGTTAGGLLLLLSFDIHSGSTPKSLLVFFALWQAAYAASSAPLLRDRPR